MAPPCNYSDVLGVHVSAVNLDSATGVIGEWIETGRKHYVCVTGVHGIMESRRDSDLMAIHNEAGLVTPDGMPLVWLSRLHGRREVSRVYGPDLMLHLFDASVQKGWRHFLYGASPSTLDLLARRLQDRFPGAQIVGRHSPPFRPVTPDEDQAEIAKMEAARPDIVWVGLSTPKQERWMAKHRGVLSAAALIGVGAAFDIHAGVLRQAPRVLQTAGLEWAFRLCVEPRRLWRRYAYNNPAFLCAIIAQALSPRKRVVMASRH
jgi:N-acetylglucosaminyldiphosphoundecaprenol N-acetyl-beta-D-mannosaminyltransferase